MLALDEPSAALDPGQRERLWTFIADLARDGTTVVFSTHNVSEAQRYAARTIVLAEGELLFDGPPAELLAAAGSREPAAGVAQRAPLKGDLEHALVAFLEARAAGPATGPAA